MGTVSPRADSRALGSRIGAKLTSHRNMLQRGLISHVLADYRRWVWSQDEASGYRIDLDQLGPEPTCAIDFEFGPLTHEHADRLFSATDLPKQDVYELLMRSRLWDSNIPTVYGATVWDKNGNEPNGAEKGIFLGWIFEGGEHGDVLADYFGHAFLPLTHGEIGLESTLNHSGFGGDSFYWIPTRIGVACWPA
jgi:hypothetical protein